MKNVRSLIILVIVTFFLVGCGSRKKTISENKDRGVQESGNVDSRPSKPKNNSETGKKVEVKVPNSTEEYIAMYKDIAIEEMKKYHIPASITLAQGILESGSGRGRLAVKANNHFGIKCHDWTGKKIYHDDDRSQECFRKYKNPSESFKDHSEFLVSRNRYSKLFTLDIDDYRGWARELRRAGYATDKRYPNKLISLIERYKLYQYDIKNQGKRKKTTTKTVLVTYKVSEGDTLYSIAKKYRLTVDELKAINGLQTNTINIGQILKVPE